MKKVSAQRKDNDLLQEATTAQLALEKRCNIIPNKPKNPYLEKKGNLDISSEKEPDYMKELANDPGYQEFINNVNETPF